MDRNCSGGWRASSVVCATGLKRNATALISLTHQPQPPAKSFLEMTEHVNGNAAQKLTSPTIIDTPPPIAIGRGGNAVNKNSTPTAHHQTTPFPIAGPSNLPQLDVKPQLQTHPPSYYVPASSSVNTASPGRRASWKLPTLAPRPAGAPNGTGATFFSPPIMIRRPVAVPPAVPGTMLTPYGGGLGPADATSVSNS